MAAPDVRCHRAPCTGCTSCCIGRQIYVATGGDAQLIGTIGQQHKSITVALDDPSAISFATMVRLGVEHFRVGADHLVFLPLIAASAVFARTPARQRLVALVTQTGAFTIGHSTSLAFAAAGVVSLPPRLVETGSAVTIVCGAIHLGRPFIARRWELAVTLAFGLDHGFGFAGTLRELGLHGRNLVAPTLGFNVGLELAQLLAAALIVPSLWCWRAAAPPAS